MESAPINLQGPLAQRRALLAKLMAQGGARPGINPAGFRAGALGGRAVHNASDLSAAPLPQINLGFRPPGMMPGGFAADPSSAMTQFPGGIPGGWNPAGQAVGPPPSVGAGFGPPAGVPAGPPDAPGGGAPVGASVAPPSSYGGPLRSVTGYDNTTGYGPLQAPDPWAVFFRGGLASRFAF